MTWTGQHHRPLLSGIRIQSGTEGKYAIGLDGAGTLTGLATRNSDGRKMLVTNLHVLAGKGANSTLQNPSGNEEMYQESLTRDKKVGSLPSWDPEYPAWLPFVHGETSVADVAMCELEDGVDADFILHDHPSHSSRKIIAGTVEPTEGMTLTMLGAATGEHTVTVQAVGLPDDFGGVDFEGVIRLHSSGATADGDSGAPCFYEVREGVYQLACIAFAHNFLRNTRVYAFPASVAEDELGITFGKRAPIASASAPGTVDPGATVTLDGSGSIDPDGDVLTYRWEQEASVGSGTVELTNADKAVATFTASNRLAALTFNLTVTDSFGQTATDAVNITVQPNRTPIANAGEDKMVDVGVTVTLNGSKSSDPDTGDSLTYSWEQPAGPSVTLSSSTAASPTFTAPSTATTLTFRLTVSDGTVSDIDAVTVRVIQTTAEEAVNKYDANGNGTIEASEAVQAVNDYFAGRCSSLEVTAVVARYHADHADSDSETSPGSGGSTSPPQPPEIWEAWTRTNNHRGSAQNREAEESRTSNLGNTETRWVPDPEPETWGTWTDTGRVRVQTGPAPDFDRIYQKEQSRTSSYDNTESKWIETGRN